MIDEHGGATSRPGSATPPGASAAGGWASGVRTSTNVARVRGLLVRGRLVGAGLARSLVLRRVVLGVVAGAVAVAGYGGLREVVSTPADGPPIITGEAGPSTSSGPSPSGAVAGVRKAAGLATLDKMTAAVKGGDRRAFLATIDPEAGRFDQQARMVFANLDKLPLATFEFRYVRDDPAALSPDRRSALGGSDAWLAQIEVSWQLSDYDLRPARETLPVTFVTRGGKTYAASFSERFGENQRRPIWLLGTLRLAEGDHSLVIGLDDGADPEQYSVVTDRAVTAVTKVWGRNWRQKSVTYLPATQQQMEFVLGARPGSYGRIAAVTMAELNTPQPGAPVRIVANPRLFEALGKQGRRIVLTHETTHVASSATASPVPLWLAEGFADYVAFTAVSVQDESAAKELFKSIRAGREPTALPAPEAFAASSPELSQAYESSWLACRLISEREGQGKLVKFYRTVHGSKSRTGLAEAFETVLGTTEEQFVGDWQKYLKRLAGV